MGSAHSAASVASATKPVSKPAPPRNTGVDDSSVDGSSSNNGGLGLASVAAAKAALQRRRAAQEDHQPQPGMPIPSGLEGVFTQKEPDDANCFERARDSILRFFAHRLVHRIFLSLSVLVCVLLVLNGLLIAYAVLGLYLRVDNGWGHYKPDCVAASLRWNQTLHALYIPKPPGAEWGWSRSTDIMYCTANQYWFNFAVKGFVVLTSYINFLPIPWRLAILHHAFCSRRSCADGHDFYGRPTTALWFNLPLHRRRVIAVLLNLAYAMHFGSFASHAVYQSYLEGQTWPGGFWQNLPFILSISSAILGGVVQGQAEAALIKARPDLYPPRPMAFFKTAVGRWWRGEASLREGLSQSLTEFRNAAARAQARGVRPAHALTGITKSYGMPKRSPTSPMVKPTPANNARAPAAHAKAGSAVAASTSATNGDASAAAGGTEAQPAACAV